VITIGKRVSFATRSFGSNAPVPDPGALAEWVGERRGRTGDLITYQLEEGLVPQIDAGVTNPCAGGSFYHARWAGSLTGVEGTAITEEIGCDPMPLLRDIDDLDLIQKNLWLATPSPSELRLTDRYFHDQEEAAHSLSSAYQEMMRAMRDAGIAGHVLLCEKPAREELEALAGRKVFFFSRNQTKKSLALLLEYQGVVAIRPSGLGLIRDLMGEYEVLKIILLDAEEEDLQQALELKDPDSLLCGGYCNDSCSLYWKSIVEKASLVR
jgi:hypothetical protein